MPASSSWSLALITHSHFTHSHWLGPRRPLYCKKLWSNHPSLALLYIFLQQFDSASVGLQHYSHLRLWLCILWLRTTYVLFICSVNITNCFLCIAVALQAVRGDDHHSKMEQMLYSIFGSCASVSFSHHKVLWDNSLLFVTVINSFCWAQSCASSSITTARPVQLRPLFTRVEDAWMAVFGKFGHIDHVRVMPLSPAVYGRSSASIRMLQKTSHLTW